MLPPDTNRNLRLFAFVREYARHNKDKLAFDQWRPYVTMMHTRAVATPLVELRDFEAALGVIDAGVEKIHRFLGGVSPGRQCRVVQRIDPPGASRASKSSLGGPAGCRPSKTTVPRGPTARSFGAGDPRRAVQDTPGCAIKSAAMSEPPMHPGPSDGL